MQNGYYQATGAMVTQFNRLDVITNNLANINTIGYKRDDVVIADFERIFKETRDILPLENHTRDAAKFLNRTIDRVPQINEIYTNFNVGGLKMTNNPLDVAIGKSDLFLLVDTPNGVRLTKNGALNLDNEGYIVTKEGYRVLPNNYENQPEEVRGIQIPQDAPVTIDKDGNISSWAIGHKDSKVKSFLQNMSEKAEEILQKQLEKAKDTKEEKEVFSMKKHKEVIKKNKVDLKV